MVQRNQTTKDKVVGTVEVYETTNYAQFKAVKGNRKVNDSHVNELVKKFEREGNLMPQRPAQVGPNKEVWDGQTRLQVCERLQWPFYYIQVEIMTMDTTRALNNGNRNWTWQDYGYSYVSEDVDAYKSAMQLYEDYKENGTNLGFNLLMAYSIFNEETLDQASQLWKSGDFKLEDINRTKRYLNWCLGIADAAGIMVTRDFGLAFIKFVRRTNYDNDKMLAKISRAGMRLQRCYLQADYLYELEDIWKNG